MEDRHLSLSEVAELMEVAERTVRRWIKSGKLKAYKPGRDYRIPESAVKEFIEGSEAYPKVQAPLPLEEATAGADPLYNAYEALGRVLASSWKDELDEWNERVPTGSALSSFNLGRLFEWVVGIGATKRTYEAIVIDTYSPVRQELQDTLRLMDDTYGEALQKCLKVIKPAQEYAEFRKIVEENNLEAIALETLLSNVVGDE